MKNKLIAKIVCISLAALMFLGSAYTVLSMLFGNL